MTAQELADNLDAEVKRTVKLDLLHFQAAGELRRLHSENEWLRGVLAHVKATLPDDVLNGHLKTMIDSTLQRG